MYKVYSDEWEDGWGALRVGRVRPQYQSARLYHPRELPGMVRLGSLNNRKRRGR